MTLTRRSFLRRAGAAVVVAPCTPLWAQWLADQMLKLQPKRVWPVAGQDWLAREDELGLVGNPFGQGFNPLTPEEWQRMRLGKRTRTAKIADIRIGGKSIPFSDGVVTFHGGASCA